MKTNAAAIALIKAAEKLELRAYRCPSNVWTIGWGHTLGVREGMVITAARAESLFQEDLRRFELELQDLVEGIPLTENQFSALVSLMFNIGPAAFTTSTLLRLLHLKAFTAAAAQFPLWCHGTDPKTKKKVVLPGLVKRRAAERALFEAP